MNLHIWFYAYLQLHKDASNKTIFVRNQDRIMMCNAQWKCEFSQENQVLISTESSTIKWLTLLQFH